MKKTTKTLLSLLVIASFTAYATANVVHMVKHSGSTNLPATMLHDFEGIVQSNLLWRGGADTLCGTAQHLLGKNGANGVHFAKDGYLIRRPSAYDEAAVDKSIAEIAAFANTGLYKVSLAVVPPAFEILRSKLPDNAYDDRITRIYERLHISFDGTATKLCDARSALERHSDEYIYYRTDSHLTSLGSYYVYSELGEVLGYGANRTEDFDREVVTKKFRGDTYDKASSLLAKRDTIEKFILPGSTNQTLKYKGGLQDTIYTDREDYLVFPGGNHDVEVITSDNGSDKKIAIVKDSYANSIVPFIANHYESIHLINLTYFNEDLAQYLTDNEITDVLILYGAENFNVGKINLMR